MTRLRRVGALLFVLSVPVLLITSNVRQVAGDLAFYERGFARYDVSERTGLSAAQLRDVARAFIEYFDDPPRRLDVQVELAGSRRPLFNEREIPHMGDVQRLMHLVERLRLLAGGTMVAVALVGLTTAGRSFFPSLGRLLQVGAVLTSGVLLLLGGLSLLDFGDVFVRFHQLAFSNDLWILDPSRDYLLMLFPEGFWFDATMRIALLTAAESAALALLGWGVRARTARS